MKSQKRKEKITRVDLSETIVDSQFTRFEADLIGGNVIIKSGPEGQASLRVQWREDKIGMFGSFLLDGDTVRLQSKGFRSFIGQKHPYIIEVTLPIQTAVTVKMMAGVLYLDDLAGDVTASLKAGEIAGNLSGKNLNIKLWAGDIKVALERVTGDSDITVKCSLGDVQLHFPQGILVHPIEESKNGNIATTVGARIIAKATLGGVRIEE